MKQGENKHMGRYFVIGDIHGCYDKLVKVLKSWDKDKEQLIFLGDLIDRGKDSLKVVQLAMQLVRESNAIVLRGNHEELLINWLLYPDTESDVYLGQGGDKTVISFVGEEKYKEHSSAYLSRYLMKNFLEEVNFLKHLPFYYYNDKYIFVHAGIDVDKLNWKNTSEKDFCWIRERFLFGKNETGYTVVFGHTPTRHLNRDKSDQVWFSSCKTKIGIDGAAFQGGYLHALQIDGEKIDIVSV